jgi:hypothetical protein
MAKDPEAAFFKRLEGLQPCEMSTLKPGTHIFAVYGTIFSSICFPESHFYISKEHLKFSKFIRYPPSIMFKYTDMPWIR